MKTRMEKYYDENEVPLRSQKNEDLYNNIGAYDVDDYELESNARVIDNNAKNIDVDKIKKILDNNYKQTPKRRSIVIDESKFEEPDINLDDTRVYDINAILEKAKETKEVDYEKDRFKKLRDTQYDILNSLDLDKDEEEVKEPEADDESNELMTLINTITANELTTKNATREVDPLDLLTDLKGSDNTVIVGGIHEDESINETKPIMSLEEADKIKPSILEKTTSMTSTLSFTQSDFDDFNDLKKEVKSSRILIYIVIVIVVILIIGGLLLFFNKFLNMELF